MGIPTSIYGMEVGQSFQRDRLLRIDPFVPGFTASTDRRTEARGDIPPVVGLSKSHQKSLLVGFWGGSFCEQNFSRNCKRVLHIYGKMQILKGGYSIYKKIGS